MSPAIAEILQQHEVSTGYFDDVAQVIAGGQTSTTAPGRVDGTGTVSLKHGS
jgi:isocitrate lyase